MEIIKKFNVSYVTFSSLEEGALFRQSSDSYGVCIKLSRSVKSGDIIYNALNLDNNAFQTIEMDRIVVPLKGTLTVEDMKEVE